MKDATCNAYAAVAGVMFQSTRPVKDATPQEPPAADDTEVSIHASREGRDTIAGLATTKEPTVSIHASREGRDERVFEVGTAHRVSIHASREGRDITSLARDRDIVVSIHASREGRDVRRHECPRRLSSVSIHASREGRDEQSAGVYNRTNGFNPRVP